MMSSRLINAPSFFTLSFLPHLVWGPTRLDMLGLTLSGICLFLHFLCPVQLFLFALSHRPSNLDLSMNSWLLTLPLCFWFMTPPHFFCYWFYNQFTFCCCLFESQNSVFRILFYQVLRSMLCWVEILLREVRGGGGALPKLQGKGCKRILSFPSFVKGAKAQNNLPGKD